MSPDQRLTQLEGRCRFLTRGLCATVIAGGLAFVLGAKGVEPPQALKVSKLEVVDAEGNVRIILGDVTTFREEGDIYGARFTDAGGKNAINIIDLGQLNFTRNKELRATLSAHDSGASFQLSCPGNKPRAMIYATSYGEGDAAGIQLRDGLGEPRFMQETPRVKRIAGRDDAGPEDPFAPKK